MPATAVALTYEDRKVRGRCTRPGCRRRASERSGLCVKHHRAKKHADRVHVNAKRDERRAARLCIWCPGDRPARATDGLSSCLACRIKRQRLRATDGGVGSDVGSDRAAAIAAATRTHADGRTRYHGQGKRGQQPKSQLNVQDLRHATQDFEGFAAGVALIASPAAETWSRGERERIELATASLGNRASGRMDDILERLGHFKQRHGRRDGDG